MYNTSKREISEEMYNRAVSEHNGYLASVIGLLGF